MTVPCNKAFEGVGESGSRRRTLAQDLAPLKSFTRFRQYIKIAPMTAPPPLLQILPCRSLSSSLNVYMCSNNHPTNLVSPGGAPPGLGSLLTANNPTAGSHRPPWVDPFAPPSRKTPDRTPQIVCRPSSIPCSVSSHGPAFCPQTSEENRARCGRRRAKLVSAEKTTGLLRRAGMA